MKTLPLHEIVAHLDDTEPETRQAIQRFVALGRLHHPEQGGWCSCGKLSCQILDILEGRFR